MGSRASPRLVPRLLPLWLLFRELGIFSLMAMERAVHQSKEQSQGPKPDPGASVGCWLILNHKLTRTTIWMRVKGWTGVAEILED